MAIVIEEAMAAKNPSSAPDDTRLPPPPADRVRKGPRGLGSMRHIPLDIDPRIDLTKPIYEQVLALRKADDEAEAAS